MPDDFQRIAGEHYLPLITRALEAKTERGVKVLGINGAQGTGKSTLALLMRRVMSEIHGCNVAVLSIDDFYLTRAERRKLAREVHPLLQTRGVPGTHDVEFLLSTLDRIASLQAGENVSIPRFDKRTDERADVAGWTVLVGPVDLVILEGWCVGTRAQDERALDQPVNMLEKSEDPTGTWRRFVNTQLQQRYADINARIDYLVFLKTPDFESVLRWRIEQESRLRGAADSGTAIMSDVEISEFIQHYERLTRHNIVSLPEIADAVLELGRDHQCVASYYS